MNIGRLLDVLDELGIAENTLVVFTSDNGPEEGAGSPGPFKGRKRYLNEGGIRVPTIVQWKGKVKAGSKSDRFAVNTDLFPTFMDAIGKPMPTTTRLDGISFLPLLLESSSVQQKAVEKHGDERVVLWYTHCLDYPKFTAAWSHGYKIIWYDYEGRKSKNLPAPWRAFNMELDPTENNNLLPVLAEQCSELGSQSSAANSSVISWSDINADSTLRDKTSQQKLAILKLMRYLQIEMYLFRYEGEFDWLLYHDNRPAETGQNCKTRKVYEINSLPWNSHINVPKFCGSSVTSEDGFGCGCEFAACSAGWYSKENTWVHPTFAGLTHFSPMKGSLQHFLRSILEWTSFQDICEGHSLISTSDATKRSAARRIEETNKLNCQHQHSNKQDIGLLPSNSIAATEEGFDNLGYSRGDFIGNEWKRSCHARVHFNDELQQYYLTTATCAYDKPILTLNFHGTPRHVAICPESFQHLMNAEKSKNYLDDSLFLAVSYLALLPQRKY